MHYKAPMPETRYTFCRICEPLCGLAVEVENERVVAIRPDREHVTTAGYVCPKGLRQHLIYGSPDRLARPQRRTAQGWSDASWGEALSGIGASVRRIVAERGPDAVAMYVGTAAGFSVLHPVFAQGFMAGLGSKSMYSSSTQDCANKFAVARALYGYPFTQPFPDLEHTRCLVIVGANPLVSKWSFLQVPHPVRRLRAIEARGGKLYVVDPRRTETAKAAGEHLFIRPDTDVFFFAAFVRELGELGAVDEQRTREHLTGWREVAELVRPWTPERAERVTGIAAAKLRELVAAYARASAPGGGGAALYSSTGVNMGSNGSLAFWLQEVINAVSGNLDRRGGTLVGRGIIDFPSFGKRTGALMREDRSRVGSLPSVNDAFAGGLLADEILQPGPGQVRALFVTGGNPLLTMPNARRLRRALSQLELLVTVDVFRNETGSLAHWILPATSPLERADLPFVFPLMLGLQARPYLQATRRVVRATGQQRDEATIYLDLARACGASLFGSRVAQTALEAMTAAASRLHPRVERSVPQELLLSLLLRAGGQGSFRSLLRATHGRMRGEHRPGDFLAERVLTDDGKVHLAPPSLLAEARAKLEIDYARELERRGAGRLKLITRRSVTTMNSWTHNLAEFVPAGRDTNYLTIHPDDAARLGLADGALADVSSDTAMVRVPLRLDPDLLPGVVALPHGWGHQHATGLSVARTTRGVNSNLLAGDGPARLERLSGMAQLTGILVDVRPAAGPQDPSTWSGLPSSVEAATSTSFTAACSSSGGCEDPASGDAPAVGDEVVP